MTAFDPAKKGPDATLSVSNSTLTNASANAWTTALADTGRSTGKYYYELKVGTLHAGENYILMAGLANAYGGGEGYSSYYLSQWANAFGLQGDGTQRLSGFTAGVSQYTTVAAAGDVFRIAVDLDAGKVWVALETSGHSGFDNSGNPATGANPFLTFTSGGTYYPAATVGGGSFGTAGGTSVVLHAGSDVEFAVPSGFSQWAGIVAPPPIFRRSRVYLRR